MQWSLVGMKDSAPDPAAASEISRLKRTNRISALVGIVMLVLVVFIAIWSLQQAASTEYWVTHTYQVLNESYQLEFDLKDTQASARAYVLQPTPQYRSEYQAATARADASFARLRFLAADNAAQEARLDQLAPVMEQRKKRIESLMAVRDRSGFADAERQREIGLGRPNSERMWALCAEIQREEYRLSAEREHLRRDRLTEGMIGTIGSAFLAFLALWVLSGQIRRAVSDLIRSDEALRANAEDLRFLTGKLLTAQEDERRRIARNLHDDLNQSLACLAMDLGKLSESNPGEAVQRELTSLRDRTRAAAELVRNISHELHPSILDDLGLKPALQEYCEEFEDRTGISTHFEFPGDSNDLAPDVASCVYYVVAECLRNVAKHAQGSSAEVHVDVSDSALHLTITDDGLGFSASPGRSGIGITAMRERLHLVKGDLAFGGAPDGGAQVTAVLPLA
jgi:signal transduction histidine kinase